MGAMIDNSVQWPKAGRYIVAVSGGADSMVLLDILAYASGGRAYELVVAHFDHGIRADSKADRLLVEEAALSYQLPFIFDEAHLGHVSEAKARAARYLWLEAARVKHHAYGVITAHHQDDLLETSMMNLARGSGRRGLAPMRSGGIIRPLIGLSRKQLRDYANEHSINWNEDSTNLDMTNPRNFLRHRLLAKASPHLRSSYLELIDRMSVLNTKIDQSISIILDHSRVGNSSYLFPREIIQELSLAEVEELIAAAARKLEPDVELDRRIIKEISLFAKSQTPHRTRYIRQNILTTVQNDSVRVYYMGISKEGRR
jgi:tRNA(Ile)-lysidine synthetase-like protein